MSQRANQLQFLRFLCFLLIFSLHCGSIYPLSWLTGGNGAAYAVSFFITLSGFVAAYSRFGKPIDCSFKSIVHYWASKLKKTYPLYFVTLLFAAVYNDVPISFTINTGEHLIKPLVIQLLKNLFLVQSWFRTGYFAYNGVGWFLSTIFFLYLFSLPALYFINLIKKCKHHVLIYICLIIALLASSYFYAWFIRAHKVEFWGYIFPPARISEYLIGMLLGFLVQDLKKIIPSVGSTAIVFTVLEASILVLIGWLITQEFPEWQGRIIVWILPTIVLLLFFGFGLGYISRLFSLKPFVALGNITFECYLIHTIIINFYRYLSGMSHTVVYQDTYYYNGNVFSLLYCLGLTLLVAFYVHHKPLLFQTPNERSNTSK